MAVDSRVDQITTRKTCELLIDHGERCGKCYNFLKIEKDEIQEMRGTKCGVQRRKFEKRGRKGI